MEEHGMPEHIRAHSLMVTRIALVIAGRLKDAGTTLSIPLVRAGALMHDIGKTPALKRGLDHSEVGRQICLEHHFDEVADIVGEHVRLKDYRLDGEFSEKEIVYYSDKRVNHDKIVSLEERQAYILDRYGKNHQALRERIQENFRLCKKVESKLFSRLNFGPEAIPLLALQVRIGPEADVNPVADYM